MADYRFNQNNKHYVIISPRRAGRPGEKKGEKPVCPFCYGAEKMTPPEVYRVGRGEPDTPGWEIRVVPNKYKITDVHEVIIHSPDHDADLDELSLEAVIKVFETYRERFNYHRDQGQVVIFNNTGKSAAASLEHRHSQLALVPENIKIATPNFTTIDNCAYADNNFSLYCPTYSEWPYEVIFMPQRSGKVFGDCTDNEIEQISRLLQLVLKGIKREVGEFDYNFYISPKKDWYLRLIPRLSLRAGFELATDIMVNIKEPREVVDLIKSSLT